MPNNRESSTSEKNRESESQDSSAVFRTRPVENTRLPEQRINLWDDSESLGEKGNNLWLPLQTNLIRAIETIPINPLNKIVLVPFYSNPQTPIEEYATEEGKKNIIKEIRDLFDKRSLFVIFVQSPNFYKSAVSLNEMGAAWALKSEYC